MAVTCEARTGAVYLLASMPGMVGLWWTGACWAVEYETEGAAMDAAMTWAFMRAVLP